MVLFLNIALLRQLSMAPDRIVRNLARAARVGTAEFAITMFDLN